MTAKQFTILDYEEDIRVPGRVFENPANEYWALLSLRAGLFFLNRQVSRCEQTARMQLNPEGNLKVKALFNVPQPANFPIELLTCAFQWYAISACQYVRIVGAIANRQDSSRWPRDEYAKKIIPEVVAYRNKVAAHYAWSTKNRKDNDAERLASIIPQISYINDRFIAAGNVVALKKGGKTSCSTAIVPWSVTKVHARLCQRYWRNAVKDAGPLPRPFKSARHGDGIDLSYGSDDRSGGS